MLKSYFCQMNKKLFIILLIFMSLSLIGITFVQGYWIKNAYYTTEEQYITNIRNSLIDTAKKIQLKELEKYYTAYNSIINDSETGGSIPMSELMYAIKKDNGTEELIFSNAVIEEDFKLSADLMSIDRDSFRFNSLSKNKEEDVAQGEDTFRRLKGYERIQFEKVFKLIATETPLHRRVSVHEIQTILDHELNKRGVQPVYEFSVFNNDLATKVGTEDFILKPETTYSVSLFVDDKLQTKYQLFVNLINQESVVLNSILGMAILSLMFTGVIIWAFYSAVKQIFQQRQISRIKTDFINNMTHEFKTPIATINLALDALKNPKVKDNKEFLDRYLGMIREENKRMHAQVENVLRISKLDKNELDLAKERVKLHDVIVDAISHVQLIVEDREGYINTHLGAFKSSVLANNSHLTNVVVNILDNAIKYSENSPKIDVYTENVKDFVVLKIRDQGSGMTKSVSKKIFEKFYREATGDVHNVKGHGLGLSYVKQILDDHDAEILVESELNKGTTFIIKLHLIT
ncbi:MAG: two-component system phosphate regulon sensor histidine kinase PhoR [Patiriisocius sp.]|jgi:two-component system phosphate regulon sensor histidine kinase PhoR